MIEKSKVHLPARGFLHGQYSKDADEFLRFFQEKYTFLKLRKVRTENIELFLVLREQFWVQWGKNVEKLPELDFKRKEIAFRTGNLPGALIF